MLHERLGSALESGVEEGAVPGGTGRAPPVPGAPRGTKALGASRLQAGVTEGWVRILSVPAAPLCGAPAGDGRARSGCRGIQSPVRG